MYALACTHNFSLLYVCAYTLNDMGCSSFPQCCSWSALACGGRSLHKHVSFVPCVSMCSRPVYDTPSMYIYIVVDSANAEMKRSTEHKQIIRNGRPIRQTRQTHTNTQHICILVCMRFVCGCAFFFLGAFQMRWWFIECTLRRSQ